MIQGQNQYRLRLHHLPESTLRPPGEAEQIHGLRQGRPNGSHGLTQGIEHLLATLMLLVVCMNQRDQRPRIDKDHRRFLLKGRIIFARFRNIPLVLSHS